MKNIYNKGSAAVVVLVVVALALVAGGSYYLGTQNALHSSGATTGPSHSDLQQFSGGVMNSGTVATSSQGAAITLTAAEFKQWANAALVSVSPGLTGTQTITLPASTTLASLIPSAGDTQRFCVRNATTTAAVYLAFAGGTGTNLLVGTSTVSTAAGASKIITGKVACFTIVRESKKAATFDIDVLMNSYQ